MEGVGVNGRRSNSVEAGGVRAGVRVCGSRAGPRSPLFSLCPPHPQFPQSRGQLWMSGALERYKQVLPLLGSVVFILQLWPGKGWPGRASDFTFFT